MRARHLGFGILGTLVALALIGPLIAPLGPFKQTLLRALAGPDALAWFGYDHLGRSMFARLSQALRLSLTIAFAATATAAALGIALGALASWRGGWIDRGLSLLADSVLALPALLMVLMMGVILPSTPLAFWAGLAAVQWIEFFRLTRSVARSTLASPAVEAATLQGFGPVWVFRRILWPEIGPMLRTTAAFGVANAVAAIAALIKEWQPVRLVVGLPVALDGTPHAMTARCTRFANQLRGRFALAVDYAEERLSSFEAGQFLRESGHDARSARDKIDAVAAQIILQSYFEAHPDAHR